MSEHINNGLHMKTDGVNKDGRITRLPTDNKVIKNAGEVSYKKNKIYYNSKGQWVLNGNAIGSISKLSVALYKITKDNEFNESTYKIGLILESNGYGFNKCFDWS